MNKQTCHEDFCIFLWANKPVIGVFAILYGHTNLPWEFLPSFMGKQTCHRSFCHLLWANKPTMRAFACLPIKDGKNSHGKFVCP
jgi:hypothetical protein